MLKPSYWTVSTCEMEWLIQEYPTYEAALEAAQEQNLKVEIINL